jgi:hypothetical protein
LKEEAELLGLGAVRASTPALLAVLGFGLYFCTALCEISQCKKGFINTFD